jgi:hypothetical protein
MKTASGTNHTTTGSGEPRPAGHSRPSVRTPREPGNAVPATAVATAAASSRFSVARGGATTIRSSGVRPTAARRSDRHNRPIDERLHSEIGP